MRVFMTGATGFAGSHLVDSLLADGCQVTALTHPASSRQPLPDQPGVTAVPGDLLDRDSLIAAVAAAQPDLIYHLAGQASPALSWREPALTLAINAGGTANLLDAAVAYGRPRVVIVTSAEIYGPVTPDMLPITEATPPAPNHPYGVSKWAAGQLAPLYWQRHGLPVMEARPFNHIGPRQATGFVVADFASQLAAIKLGQQPPQIAVGNLSAERDFSDVRDVTAAYRQIAAQGQPGAAYLICSGQPTPVNYLLTTLAELAAVPVEIVYDPARMRPSDVPVLYGSYAKLAQETGWRPTIHLRQSLADALADWLERLNG